MAGNAYRNKGYSTYTNIPPQRGSYDYEPNMQANMYVVETTTIERVRGPALGHANFDGYPSMLMGPKYMTKEHHEIYEPDYGSDYENSSSPRYYGSNDIMNDFSNKVQIDASRPLKAGNVSSPNKYQPSSPNKYKPLSPNRYRPSSPNEHHPSSPNKHHPSSPNKYRPSSPNNYHPSSLNKYQPSNSVHNYEPNKNLSVKTQNFSSPNKYDASSLIKHNLSNPTAEGVRHVMKGNFSSPNKHDPSSPIKHNPSSPTAEGVRHVMKGNFSSPDNSWMGVGPPNTHHPLTTATNNMNEALRFLEESVNPPHSGPKQRVGMPDDSSPRARIIEPERQSIRPTLSRATAKPHYNNHMSGGTIDSREAMRKYGGALVP